MTEDGGKRNLGRGLAALLGADTEDTAAADRALQSRMMPIESLRPGPYQPRHRFDDEQLRLLADSIRENGILQPILVRRRAGASDYEIVAGERRWRAAQLARLHEVPVIVREIGDREALELALVENVQRQDLSPMEEAEGYRRLMDEFRNTQDDLARRVGKSRSHIANALRLLNLPEPVRAMLDGGELTAGHARALLGAADPIKLAKQVVERGLNVRQAERLAQISKNPTTGHGQTRPAKDADTLALERDLTAVLGLKVTISFNGQGGSLTVHYRTVEQLDDLLGRLNKPAALRAE